MSSKLPRKRISPSPPRYCSSQRGNGYDSKFLPLPYSTTNCHPQVVPMRGKKVLIFSSSYRASRITCVPGGRNKGRRRKKRIREGAVRHQLFPSHLPFLYHMVRYRKQTQRASNDWYQSYVLLQSFTCSFFTFLSSSPRGEFLKPCLALEKEKSRTRETWLAPLFMHLPLLLANNSRKMHSPFLEVSPVATRQ